MKLPFDAALGRYGVSLYHRVNMIILGCHHAD